ncbi:MAG TPA: response regulator, partial [Thermoleophilaceae bacterium]|nr:response regulator [Thermoleophilaceae bacterium]
IGSYLSDRGLACESASTVSEALAALEGAVPGFEVVVADIGTSGAGAVELAGEMDTMPALRETPVIMLSRTQEQRQAAQLAGCDRLLGKPVRRGQLFEAVAEAAAGEHASVTAAPTRVAAFASSNSRPLLVVEDNAVNQLVIKKMLAARGFTVEIAGNGLEALEFLSGGHDFAAVFMDCQMPELDGYGATAQIRAREHGVSRLPIIAMTANTMKGDRERCIDSGMDDYLPKPLRPGQLDAVLERWIGPSGGVGALASEPAR